MSKYATEARKVQSHSVTTLIYIHSTPSHYWQRRASTAKPANKADTQFITVIG